MKRSSPLARKTPLRRLTRLRAVSKRARRREADLADAKVVVYQRSHGLCEAKPLLGWCDRFGFHFHHVQPRSRGGAHTPENLKFICSASHSWIHSHPIEAARLGLLRSSWERVS